MQYFCFRTTSCTFLWIFSWRRCCLSSIATRKMFSWSTIWCHLLLSALLWIKGEIEAHCPWRSDKMVRLECHSMVGAEKKMLSYLQLRHLIGFCLRLWDLLYSSLFIKCSDFDIADEQIFSFRDPNSPKLHQHMKHYWLWKWWFQQF